MYRWLFALSFFAFACGTALPVEDDAGPPPNCDDPDTACPSGAPVWSGPCAGTLSCPFVGACGPGSEDIYECVGGQWTLTMPGGCAGGSPPLAESCAPPFAGTLAGGRAWISADAAGAPELADGGTIAVAFGAQGLAMIPYRVHVEGDGVPSCVSVTTTLTLDGMAGAPATHDIRLRCGGSLRIRDILPMLPCELRPYAVNIDVVVEGVGSVNLDLTVNGGMCPRAGG